MKICGKTAEGLFIMHFTVISANLVLTDCTPGSKEPRGAGARSQRGRRNQRPQSEFKGVIDGAEKPVDGSPGVETVDQEDDQDHQADQRVQAVWPEPPVQQRQIPADQVCQQEDDGMRVSSGPERESFETVDPEHAEGEVRPVKPGALHDRRGIAGEAEDGGKQIRQGEDGEIIVRAAHAHAEGIGGRIGELKRRVKII